MALACARWVPMVLHGEGLSGYPWGRMVDGTHGEPMRIPSINRAGRAGVCCDHGLPYLYALVLKLDRRQVTLYTGLGILWPDFSDGVWN